MKRSLLVAFFALCFSACDDKPTTAPNNRTWQGFAPTRVGPNDPPVVDRPYKPLPEPWPTIVGRSFDGYVLEKHPGGFVFRGLSGRKYLLLPTQRLTDREPTKWSSINYEQIQVGQKLRVHLPLGIPYAPAYLCEAVILHGVKPPGSRPYRELSELSDDKGWWITGLLIPSPRTR